MFFFLSFAIGPSVNRHKLYLKNIKDSGSLTPSPTPTQIINYQQFSDMPSEERSDEAHYHHHQGAKVDVHSDPHVSS